MFSSHVVWCYLFLVYTFLSQASQSTVSKSATMIPSDHTDNGAEVVFNANDGNVIITDNEWNINLSNNQGWDLHIAMDQSWTFRSDQISIFTIKVYSQSLTNSADNNILFTFAQNQQKYLSSIIQINGKNTSKNNGIFPHCKPSNINTAFANGDINTLLNDTQGIKSREYKLTQTLNYESITNASHTTNTFPLIIQLINDPIHQWSKYKHMSAECMFEQFATNNTFDVYISAADIGQILNINKIEISITRNQTEDITSESEESSSDEKVTDITMFIETNHRFIVLVLICITGFLFIICNILLAMLINLSVENRRSQSANSVNNISENMERELTVSSQMSEYNSDGIDTVL